VNVGFYQFCPAFGEVTANLERIENALQGCRTDLIVLPELASTGYLLRDREEALELSEPVPGGPTTDAMARLSSDLSCMIVFGVLERSGEDLFNSAASVTPEGDVHVYRKTHLFDREKTIFEPGDTGFFVVEFRGMKVGPMVCFDWIFPESARVLAVLGADVVAHPANLVLPWAPRGMQIRAIENHVFTITANRTGTEERAGTTLRYIGQSQVTDAFGKVLVSAGESEEKLATVEIDPKDARDKTVTSRNHVLRDRRIRYYEPLWR
jgi:predicted amidohydrolase